MAGNVQAGGGARAAAHKDGVLVSHTQGAQVPSVWPAIGMGGGAEREHTESCEPCFAEEEAGCSRKESTEREIREVSRVRPGDECSTEV